MEAELPSCYSDMRVLAPAVLFAFRTGDRNIERDRDKDTGKDKDTGAGAVSDLQAQDQTQTQVQSDRDMSVNINKEFAGKPLGIQVTRAPLHSTV